MTPKESNPKSPTTSPKEISAAQCATPIEISSELLTALQVRVRLTESQSRAYTVLLVMGQLTADEVSNYSGIPMAKMKNTIEELEKKQLIKSLPGVVTRYRAFAPYKELAQEVKVFTKDTQESWKELQKLQNKTLGEIHDELQTMTRQTRTALENLNERQGIALNEAAMATNIVLSNLVENLQTSLDNLISSSADELSNQNTSIQQALNNLINEGIIQLGDTQKLALDDAAKAIDTHQDEANQWLSSTADELISKTTATSEQVKSQLKEINTLLQGNIDRGSKTFASNITSQKEAISELTEETAIILTNEIGTYKKETQQMLDNLQKELKQDLTKHNQNLAIQIRDTWTQRIQALNNIISQLNKIVITENRLLTQQTDRAATTIDSTIKSNRDASEQIIEKLFQDLKNVHNHSALELRRLHKEALTTVTKWPPSSLNFAQFSKIKASLSNLMEQVKTEHEQILENASQGLGIDMRDTYLAQILEVQALLQTLIEESKTQKETLGTNFKSISDQVGRRLKRRLRTVQKTAERFLTDFQTKIRLHEEQHRTFSKQMQKLLNSEATTTINTLDATEKQLAKYASRQLKYAQGAIRQSAADNKAQAVREQKALEKEARAFRTVFTKIKNKTTSELQKELAKLESMVRQYSEGIESTADKLRAEQVLKIETTVGNYQPAISEIQISRDKSIARIFRSLTTQLAKRDQEILSNLNLILGENIPFFALQALNDYQTSLRNKMTTLETQAVTAIESKIPKQITAARLKSFDSVIKKALNLKLDNISASFQEFLASQQSLQDKQSDTAFNLARDEFIEVYSQQISKYNELVINTFNNQIKPIMRDCKTKISRQTKREKQIDKLLQVTLEKIRTLPKTVLTKEKKVVCDKLTKELETIFQTFRTQLKKQTNREKQIAAIFQSNETKLEALYKAVIPELSERHLSNQIMDLLSVFVEYQSALERQHLTNKKRVNNEFQSMLKQLIQANLVKSLKTQLNSLLKKSGRDIIDTYRRKIKDNQIALENQTAVQFQTTLEKQLRTQLQPKLREYSTTQIPSLSEPVDKVTTKIVNRITKADANTRTLIEKYWLPLTKIINDYSSSIVGNLTALNRAIGTAVDQAIVNMNTNLTNFEDDTTNLLATTVQAIDREKTGINEQITQSITEMQEDCIAQLQETQTILESLSSDVSVQKTAVTEKIKTMTSEIENTTTSYLSEISESANSFVESVQSELQTQEARVGNLKKNIQDLIQKQGTVLIEGVNKIQTQLEEVSDTQIPYAQQNIEEIGQTYATRIDEQRAAINQLLESFASSLSEETDDYVSTLQQELVQLQTVIAKLVEKIGYTSETIDTELIEQIETSKVNLLNTMNAQQTALSTETSATFQSLAEQSREIQSQMQDSLNHVAKEGKEVLDQNQTEIDNALENILNTTLSKNDKSYQLHTETLKTTTQNMIAQLGENLSTFGTKIDDSSNKLSESVTSELLRSQTEFNKLLSDIGATIDENTQTFQTVIGQEVEKALQSQSKAMSLTETRLNRAVQDSMRRMKESLQNFKGATSKDLQQKNRSVTATIKQVLDNAKEGLVTQTQQTGRRLSRTLSKERQTLKVEYQSLAKEITARAKTAETTAINTLQLFTTQTEPTLNRLRTQASQTEEILIGLWDTLTKMEPAEAERTWRIVTCEGIQTHLLDMFRRVDETITLVYPSFDEVPITELSKVQPQNRIHIITTLDGEKHLAIAQKLLQQGNIRIWNNPKMEFYGGSRDGEEVLIAPTYGNQGEIVAVVSDQASYIALFNQTLGPRWISSSNEIRLRD